MLFSRSIWCCSEVKKSKVIFKQLEMELDLNKLLNFKSLRIFHEPNHFDKLTRICKKYKQNFETSES